MDGIEAVEADAVACAARTSGDAASRWAVVGRALLFSPMGLVVKIRGGGLPKFSGARIVPPHPMQ